jgi:hypothetical protein
MLIGKRSATPSDHEILQRPATLPGSLLFGAPRPLRPRDPANSAAAGRGRRGRSLHPSAQGRALLALFATRRMRHTRGPPGAHPAFGRGRRGRPRCASGTGMCWARCDREAPDAALAWAALCTFPSAGRGRQGRLRRTSGTGTCWACGDREAPDAAHTWAAWRASCYRTWQAGVVASPERHGDVLGSLRLRCAGCCTRIHDACSSRRGRSRRTSGTCAARLAQCAAHTWAARCTSRRRPR